MCWEGKVIINRILRRFPGMFFLKKINIKLSTQVKASTYYFICSVVQKLISFVTMPLFTRFMSTDEYAIYTLFITWQNFLLIFTSLSLHNAIFNKAMVKYSKDKDGVVSSFYGLIILLTIGSFFFLVPFIDVVSVFMQLNKTIIVLLFVDLLFCPSMQIWMARERFEYRYKHVVIVSVVVALMNPLLGIVGVLFFEDKSIGRILSIVLVDVVVGFVLYIIALQKNKRIICFEYWKFAIKNNVPMIPHYLSGMILNYADRIMISYYCHMTYAAIYGVAYSAALASQIAINAINASLTPWLYRRLHNDELESVKRVNTEIIIFIAIIIVFFVLLGPEVIYVLGGEAYIEAINVFPFVACSVFYIFLYSRFADVEFFYGKNKYILVASVVCAILNVFLNWVFIPIYGFVAAGVTTLVCYVSNSLIHGFFVWRILGKMRAKTIYDLRIIIALSVLILVLPIIMIYLYQYTVIRYLIIAMSLLVAIVFGKRVIAYLKKTMR